ncbi:MAG: sterol desaturase family protein [Deltaproteobacteria bacterium]|nr:sterol desaturase family protein [Deltaproteobacteria bacterium]MBW2696103.1 sterol desaturase family protein [Deltaproteobacteria bacterium]
MRTSDLGTFLQSALDQLDNPLAYLFAEGQRIHWLYLLVAGLVAVVVYAKTAPGKTSLRSFVRLAFPRSVYLSRSTFIDCGYFLVHRVLFSILCLPVLALLAPAIAEATGRTLGAGLPALEATVPSSPLWIGLFTVVAILVADFAGFLAHYLLHRFPVLWEFHKVHHSAQAMTPITVYRMHPVDDIGVVLLSGTGLAITLAVFQFVTIGEVGIVSVGATNIFAVLFNLFGANLRHTHLWFGYGPRLSQILVSPAMHQIHHSQKPHQHHSNMGFMFSFWDRLFGTQTIPREREEIVFGLDQGEDADYSSVLRLFWLPFAKIFRMKSGLRVLSGGLIGVALLALSVSSVVLIASSDSTPDLVALEMATE